MHRSEIGFSKLSQGTTSNPAVDAPQNTYSAEEWCPFQGAATFCPHFTTVDAPLSTMAALKVQEQKMWDQV